jgi:hypothetical protein
VRGTDPVTDLEGSLAWRLGQVGRSLPPHLASPRAGERDGSGNRGRFMALDRRLPVRGEDRLEIRRQAELADGPCKPDVGDVGFVPECAGQRSFRP